MEEPDELTSFHLNGFTIFARPDLLYRDEDGMYHLVDWKTGKPSASHLQQLRVYGLFVYSRGDLEAGPMQGHLEYVYAGSRADSAITAAELESQEREIAASVSKMRRYLEDAERNKPLPMSEFPRTNETSECRWCKFYELCGDGS